MTEQQELKNKPQRKRKKITNPSKVMIGIILVAYLIFSLASAYMSTRPVDGAISYNALLEKVKSGDIEKVRITKDETSGVAFTKEGKQLSFVNPGSDDFVETLMKNGANIEITKKTMFTAVMNVVATLPMIVLTAMLALYIASTIVGGNTKKFTLLKAKNNATTFDDIRGITETKEEVRYLVETITDWKKVAEAGARTVNGIMFYGPAGTGKTLLAKAIAKEAKVPFISTCGSDFNEMFVGVGAARVRALWELAEANSPCIIFIDEIDSLGSKRGGGESLGMKDSSNTVNALLQKMDGLNRTPGIMVIAATNRLDDLDPALLRSGRFDRKFYVGPPTNKKDRDDVVELYLKDKKLEEGVTVEKVSKLLVGLTAADIEEALSDAVMISFMDKREGVLKYSDVDEAVMRLNTKGVKKEHSSKRDVEISAIHEAGHTVMGLLTGTPIAKVSVMAYTGGMGGVTVPDQDILGDNQLKFESEYIDEIKMLLAGEVAETLKYGEHTQGCSSDIAEATRLVSGLYSGCAFGDHMVSVNKLVNNGLEHSFDTDAIRVCDDMLLEYEKEVKASLSDNFDKVERLAEMLVKEKTVVDPTLEMLS